MGDRFAPGDQVRVDTGYGDSFYGTYLHWRPQQNVWVHLVRAVAFRLPSKRIVSLGDDVRCTDKEVEACAFVVKPPTSIEEVEQFLEEGVSDRP
jgi:hypothetical protein